MLMEGTIVKLLIFGNNRDVDDHLYCEQYQKAAELIGSRWTAAIVRALLGGAHHFSSLKAAIPGLSDRMLAERLRELEREGITERIVIADMPVRVEYRLTKKGKGLSKVMNAIIEWLATWSETAPVPLAREK